MKHRVFWGYLAVATILAVPLVGSVHWLYARPDVYLIGIFFACTWFGARWSLAYSIVCGMLKASLSGHGMFGTVAAALVWWLVLVQLSKKITMEQDTVKTAVMAGMLFLQSFVLRPLVYQGKAIPVGIVLRTAALELLYTVALFYGLLRVFANIYRKIASDHEDDIEQGEPLEEVYED